MPSFWGCWKYAELRTNAIDQRCALLLREKTKMHPVPHSDQRGVKTGFGSPELTPREAEVLFWISKGKSNHDIGVILGAKTGTICKHVGHILSKLNVENRTSAAVAALERRRSVEETSAIKPGEARASIAVAIGSQFAEFWSSAYEFFDVLPSFVA